MKNFIIIILCVICFYQYHTPVYRFTKVVKISEGITNNNEFCWYELDNFVWFVPNIRLYDKKGSYNYGDTLTFKKINL